MGRFIAIVYCTVFCVSLIQTAVADPLHSAGAHISGEAGYYTDSVFQSPTPVFFSGIGDIPSGTVATVSSSSSVYKLTGSGLVQGNPNDYSEGIITTATGTVEETLYPLDENNQPITFGTIKVIARYNAAMSFSGIDSGVQANFNLSVFGFDFDGDDDFVSMENTSGGNGFLTVEWTGDFTDGVHVLLDGYASTRGGTFEIGNPTVGEVNTEAYITSILVNGNAIYTVPEPSTWAVMLLGGAGALAIVRKRARRAKV
ncbi:MAG: PEP-CTERM sorting domain-containing protein [Pirellulales bacterium]|nr:PEP-CTERM sorting domain-containing protein [Pirellulales bacterium]